MRLLILHVIFPLAFICLQCDASSCLSLPPTAFTLPDILSAKDSDEHGNGMVVNHGIEFVDVNGDGLADLVWGYGDTFPSETSSYACIYLNTGCGWGKQPVLLPNRRDLDHSLLDHCAYLQFSKAHTPALLTLACLQWTSI